MRLEKFPQASLVYGRDAPLRIELADFNLHVPAAKQEDVHHQMFRDGDHPLNLRGLGTELDLANIHQRISFGPEDPSDDHVLVVPR